MRLPPPPPPPPSIIEGGASPRPNLFTVLMIFLHCKRHFGRRLKKKKKLTEPCNSKEKQLWTCKVPPSPSPPPTAILFLTFLPSSVIKNIHPHLVSTTVDAEAAVGFERRAVGFGRRWLRLEPVAWLEMDASQKVSSPQKVFVLFADKERSQCDTPDLLFLHNWCVWTTVWSLSLFKVGCSPFSFLFSAVGIKRRLWVFWNIVSFQTFAWKFIF